MVFVSSRLLEVNIRSRNWTVNRKVGTRLTKATEIRGVLVQSPCCRRTRTIAGDDGKEKHWLWANTSQVWLSECTCIPIVSCVKSNGNIAASTYFLCTQSAACKTNKLWANFLTNMIQLPRSRSSGILASVRFICESKDADFSSAKDTLSCELHFLPRNSP